jgi:integrase
VSPGSDNIIPFPGRQEPAPGAPTFRELADEWLRTEGARLVCPGNEVRHLNHMRPLWGLTEAELRPVRVKEVLASLLQPKGPLSAASVNKCRATGKRIIREAQINDRWAGTNPFDIVRRYKEQKPDHRVLSLSEARQLLPHLLPDKRREVLTMLYLGLRPGEWKALHKSDIDFRSGELVVHRSLGRDRTKTGKVRRVPIPDGLLPILEEAVSLAVGELVFGKPDGRMQRADAKLSRMLHGALVRAGIISSYHYRCSYHLAEGCGHTEDRRELVAGLTCPKCGLKLWAEAVPPPVRYYDLRHSAATLHREAGCDPLVIQLALGHTPQSVTDSVYTHLSPDYVRKELNRLQILPSQLSLL